MVASFPYDQSSLDQFVFEQAIPFRESIRELAEMRKPGAQLRIYDISLRR
jgi:hypothetical protein